MFFGTNFLGSISIGPNALDTISVHRLNQEFVIASVKVVFYFFTSMPESSSPFLFPTTIVYSLMCAAILYIMWKQVSGGRGHSGGRSDTDTFTVKKMRKCGMPGLQQGQHRAVLGDPGAHTHQHLAHPLLCLCLCPTLFVECINTYNKIVNQERANTLKSYLKSS